MPASCPTWHQWSDPHGRLAPVRRRVWEEVLADWCAWPPTRANEKPTEAVTGVGNLGAEQGGRGTAGLALFWGLSGCWS